MDFNLEGWFRNEAYKVQVSNVETQMKNTNSWHKKYCANSVANQEPIMSATNDIRTNKDYQKEIE